MKKNKLVEIFRVVLEIEDPSDIENVRRLDHSRWDSLAHISLVVAIESEFGLQLSIADMDRMTSFAATRLMLEEKGL
jgi:acyl carrier protein